MYTFEAKRTEHEFTCIISNICLYVSIRDFLLGTVAYPDLVHRNCKHSCECWSLYQRNTCDK